MKAERYYNGHKIVTVGKYDAIYLTGHPRTLQNGTVYVHVLVAENKLKRHLTPKEVVHHIDENKQNNDENNIMIFASAEDHLRYHMAVRYNCVYILIEDNGVYHCKINKSVAINTCDKCGKELISQKSVLCRDCRNKENSKNIPSFSILSELIQDYSFEEIGRIYHVSGKAVRKWCDKYQIKKETFYETPPRERVIEILNKTSSRKEAAQKLNVPCDTLMRWEKKLGINILPYGRIKCVELNQIFQNKRDAARCMFPQLNPAGCANCILKACRTKGIYKNYHWELLPQQAY